MPLAEPDRRAIEVATPAISHPALVGPRAVDRDSAAVGTGIGRQQSIEPTQRRILMKKALLNLSIDYIFAVRVAHAAFKSSSPILWYAPSRKTGAVAFPPVRRSHFMTF